MGDAVLTSGRNVIDLADYRQERAASAIRQRPVRALCRHCGAALGEGERDDDCSSAGLDAAMPARPIPRRTFRAE